MKMVTPASFCRSFGFLLCSTSLPVTFTTWAARAMLEQMMSGTIDGVIVTDMMMLLGGIMIEIPILMTVLAFILPSGANRWANIGVGLLTMGMIVAMNLKPDLDNVFFMGIQLIALIAIVVIAWRWRGSGQAVAITS